jgi:leader peptidase (prepilin peptidase) / N-methyltransferase
MSTFVIVAALAGIFVGGLVNILADNLPYSLHIRRPHYADGTSRPAIAWLGLTAFLARKRSTPDGKRLSWRYPAVEVATSLLFAFTAVEYGVSAVTCFWCGIMAILVLITVIDLEHRLILFVVIIPACIYAIIGGALLNGEISDKIVFRDYLIGGLAGFGLFFLMYLGGFVFTYLISQSRQEEVDEVAFGYGDVMLATLSGLILGWQALIFALFITVFAGAAGALVFIIVRVLMGHKYELFTPLPYGQYIVIGTIVMMLWRTPLINYLQGF